MIARDHIKELFVDRTHKGLHCPWIDEIEWKAVCSWLYGESLEDKRKGIHRVAAWRARGTIPFPVESTADIVECLLRDEAALRDKDISTDESLSLLFAMVITRFINAIHDYGYWQGKRGRIHEVVTKFGIPHWLVELRHSSTHRVLPSLSTLRYGAQFAYQWLWTNYWKPQYSSLPLANTGQLMQQISSSWQQSQKVESSQLTTLSHFSEEHCCLPRSSEILRNGLQEYSKCNTNKERQVKVKSIYKSLANTHLYNLLALLKEEIFLNPDRPDEYDVIVPDRAKLLEFPTLSLSLVNKWETLLFNMGRYHSSVKTNLIHVLIIAVHNFKSITNAWRQTLAGWLGIILTPSSQQIVTHKSSETSIQVHLDLTEDKSIMPGDIQCQKLLEIAKDYPGLYSYAITERLLSYMSFFDASKRESILHLNALVTISERISSRSVSSLSLPLLNEEYERELQELKVKVINSSQQPLPPDESHNEVDADKRTMWKKANGPDWYNCPLGCIPGQQLTPLTFDLPTDVRQETTEEQPTGANGSLTQWFLTLSPDNSEECDEDCNEQRETSSHEDNGDINSVQLQMIQQAISLY